MFVHIRYRTDTEKVGMRNERYRHPTHKNFWPIGVGDTTRTICKIKTPKIEILHVRFPSSEHFYCFFCCYTHTHKNCIGREKCVCCLFSQWNRVNGGDTRRGESGLKVIFRFWVIYVILVINSNLYRHRDR